jgi:signal transduction histidine kinase
MNIFRQLRWKLILNYTIVTVSAFLVVILILGAIVIPRIFVQESVVNPEGLIRLLQKNNNPLWGHVLSQSPVDTDLIQLLLRESDPQITSFDFLRIGSIQFTVRTMATFRVLVLGADGTLLGKTENSFPAGYVIGQPFNLQQVQGLEAPFHAALAGGKDASQLYTTLEPNEKFVLVLPISRVDDGSETPVAGTIVVFVDNFPNQTDVPAHILNLAARSLLIFLLAIGILGSIFGAFFAHGLSARFNRLAATIDAWSEGDFSKFIDDTIGDEISQLAGRLNNMAKQLQGLLRRRQEMAVSEERNRLARDLHDSAKQQALAASFQLGTALTLYESDPLTAKQHLVEADGLVDSVRIELTELVHKLRPQPVNGEGFSETLKEYVVDWSHRNGIELTIDIAGDDEVSLETREALFRITQEALANIARHSAAGRVDVTLKYDQDVVKMTIQDDGHGFKASAQHGGLGLHSMRERAEVLGGSFTIESSVEQGTRITVSLPRLVDKEAL